MLKTNSQTEMRDNFHKCLFCWCFGPDVVWLSLCGFTEGCTFFSVPLRHLAFPALAALLASTGISSKYILGAPGPPSNKQ
eukprot:4717727-Amphidinium_carterae.1